MAACTPAAESITRIRDAVATLERAAFTEILGLAVETLGRHAESGVAAPHDPALIAAIDAWRRAEVI